MFPTGTGVPRRRRAGWDMTPCAQRGAARHLTGRRALWYKILTDCHGFFGEEWVFLFFDNQFTEPVPGNGIDGGPEKTGMARFLEILSGEYATVIKVNLLFLLTCLPVITIPLAIFSLHHVSCRMVQGRTAYYWETFRSCWRRAYAAFALTALPLVMSAVGGWFYLQRAGTQPLFFVPFLFCSTIFLVVLLSSGYFYSLMGTDMGVGDCLRLGALLGVGRPLRAVLGALCGYGFTLAGILAFPISLVYLVLVGFSLPSLLSNFFLRTVLRPYVQQRY